MTGTRCLTLLAALGALGALGCAAPQSSSAAPDAATVKAEVDSLWRTYEAAAMAGNVDAVVALYADSATVLESGMATMRGRESVRGIATELFKTIRIAESRIRPDMTDIDGDRVFQYGTYQDLVESAGQPTQRVYGRFSAVLDRQPAGGWRIRSITAVVDSTVAQPAPAR